MGIDTTSEVISALKTFVREQGLIRTEGLRTALRAELRSRLITPLTLDWQIKPAVILIVGVNGSGKTTTIAKLGKRFITEGKTILFGAADTFRAAAVDQLQVWGERLNVEVISGAPESDPGAVAFNAVQAGVARKKDIILIDNAGVPHRAGPRPRQDRRGAVRAAARRGDPAAARQCAAHRLDGVLSERSMRRASACANRR